MATAHSAPTRKTATHKAPARKSATSKSAADKSKAPWDKGNPKAKTGEKSTHLSPAAKASAKKHAEAAGRPYPNLVDNMQAAKKSKAKAA